MNQHTIDIQTSNTSKDQYEISVTASAPLFVFKSGEFVRIASLFDFNNLDTTTPNEADELLADNISLFVRGVATVDVIIESIEEQVSELNQVLFDTDNDSYGVGFLSVEDLVVDWGNQDTDEHSEDTVAGNHVITSDISETSAGTYHLNIVASAPLFVYKGDEFVFLIFICIKQAT